MGARSVQILSTQEANVPLFCQRVNLKLGLTFRAHSCNESQVVYSTNLDVSASGVAISADQSPSQLYFKKIKIKLYWSQLGKCDLHIWQLEPTTSKASGLRLGFGPTLHRKATELECRWDLQAGGHQATTSFFFSFTFLCFYLTFPSLSSFSCTSLRDPKSLFSPLIWRWRKGKKRAGLVYLLASQPSFIHTQQPNPFFVPTQRFKVAGRFKKKTVLIHWPELPSATLCVVQHRLHFLK